MKEFQNKTLPELAAFLRAKAKDSIEAMNLFALCCWFVRVNHFQGSSKTAAQWVRDNTPVKEPDQISRLMAVGRTIAGCAGNADVYNFLLLLPIGKNEVLTALDAGQVIQFVTEQGQKVIEDLGRDDLRSLVNTFLGRAVRNKPEKLFQPDLLEYAEKAAGQDDPEALMRIADRAARKGAADAVFDCAAAQLSYMGTDAFKWRFSEDRQQYYRRKFAELAAEMKEDARRYAEQSAHEAGNSLPVKQEKQPAPVQKIARPRNLEAFTDYQLQVADQRMHYVHEVFDLTINGVSTKEAVRQVNQGSGDRFNLARTYNRENGGGDLTIRNYYAWLAMLDKDSSGNPVWDRLKLAPIVSGRKSTGFNGPAEFLKILTGLFLNRNQRSIAACYDEAVKFFREHHPDQSDVALPDVNHCRYWLSKTPEGVKILKREGETAFKNKVAPFVRRDWSGVKVNQCWYADSRKFDIMVRKFNEEKNRWEAVRPWICAFTDSRSWKYVGWTIGTESIDSGVVINTFARAVYEHGEPDAVYFDNGGDYQKRGFSQPVRFEPDGPQFSILGKLGISLRTAHPYNGRAKTIERIFGYQSRRFDRRFACYLGNRPAVRPENAAMYSKTENIMFLPSLHEFTVEFEKWLSEYHAAPNRGRIVNGRALAANEPGLSPDQAYSQLPRITRPKRSLDDYKRCFLLPLDELRKVQRGGAVVIDKLDYIADALYEYLDRKVMIQIDLQDRNHVYAFTPDGKFIAECVRPGTVPALVETEADKKLLADEMKRQRGSLKAAGKAAAALTGGQLDKFSAQQLDQATSEQFRQLEDGRAQVRIAGEYHSVQGDHAAKIYSLPGSEPPTEQPPPQPAEEMSEEERKKRQEFFDAMYE